MYRSGLLLLTQPLHIAEKGANHILSQVFKKVKKRLYVHLLPSVAPSVISDTNGQAIIPCQVSTLKFVTNYYREASSFCISSSLLQNKCDMRILLSNISNKKTYINPQVLNDPFEVIFIDQPFIDTDIEHFKRYICKNFMDNDKGGLDVPLQTVLDTAQDCKSFEHVEVEVQKTYDSVCVGGTFDRIHLGHNILLSHTCLLAEEAITVGVVDSSILSARKKVLSDLIQSTDVRINDVLELLRDVKPCIDHRVTSMCDPCGPSIVDPDIEAIVVSDETVKGGQYVNDKRNEKGMKGLDIYKIELVEDKCHSQYEENKISSSSARKRLLGSLLKPPQHSAKKLAKTPYIIGLTGGIASGKSSVGKRLEKLGAAIIDCDKLGHKAYLKGTEAFNNIVDTFGQDVVGEDGEINRKVLGPKVFSSKVELNKLNNIVWPAIAKLVEIEIQLYAEQGKDIVVLDAAVLLEAGWDNMVHEVWTAFVPKEEAVKRIIDRNNLTEEQAMQRIDSQMTNSERLDKANVAVCTLWEYEYTQQQVEKAWKLLSERINTCK